MAAVLPERVPRPAILTQFLDSKSTKLASLANTL
jgi:hypothetical protein